MFEVCLQFHLPITKTEIYTLYDLTILYNFKYNFTQQRANNKNLKINWQREITNQIFHFLWTERLILLRKLYVPYS